ncbi:hypothetical protein ACFVVM_16705 [Nocardia sp. NPDC058176]|uniref:hypothetical protein n=1 Tax=Nocardia sp. NPDC058176 TaxID=3346368 RepID=UPI0036DA01EC
MTQSDTTAARTAPSPGASTDPAAELLTEIETTHTWRSSLDDLVATLEAMTAAGWLDRVPTVPTTEVIDPTVTRLPGAA